MAKKSLEIEMKIAADVSELKKAQIEINDFQRRMQTTFNQIRSGLTLNIGAGIGNRLAQIPSLINSSISAYARQEGAEANLAAAIRATGAQAKDAAESLKALASNLQSITTYGDEAILEMEALAVSLGVPADKMRECIEGAIGLSKAFKVDFKTATVMAAEVLQGSTKRLNEYIPALKNATSTAERLSLAQSAMARGFSQAKAETETLEGAVRQCSNIWGDNAEIVGKSLAPAYRAFIEIVTALGNFLNENPRIIAVATRGFIAMAAAMSIAPIAKYLNAQKSLAAQLNVLRLRQSAYLIAAAQSNDVIQKKILLQKADAAAAQIAAASTRSLSAAVKGLAASFGPVGLAMVAFTAVIEALMYAWEKLEESGEKQREEIRKTQEEINKTAAKSKSSADAMAKDVETQGGKFLDIMDKVELAAKRESAAMSFAAELRRKGFDASAVEREAAAWGELAEKLLKNREAYQKVYEARLQTAGESLAAEKSALVPETDEAKRDRLSKEILKTKTEMYRLEFRMHDAQAAQDADAAEAAAREYAEKSQSLKAAEKEFKTVSQTLQTEARRIEEGRRKAQQYKEDWQYEKAILDAKTRGAGREIEELERNRRIANYKRQIVEALRSQARNSDELGELEKNAEAAAKNRVDLENRALAAERARVELKNREKSVEDYIYRIKIAQAKLRGDEESVKKLEEMRDSEKESEQLAASAGIDKAAARRIVNATRTAEAAANERAQPSPEPVIPGTSEMPGIGAAQRPRGPTPPRAAVSRTKRDANGNPAVERLTGGMEGWLAKNPMAREYRSRGLNAAAMPSGLDRMRVVPKKQSLGNPANDAGGLVKNSPDDERNRMLKSLSETVAKVMESLKKVENNTAASAQKPESKKK